MSNKIEAYDADGQLKTTSAGSGGAPVDATYITQTANGTLTNEQALSSLATGDMVVTNGTGVITSLKHNLAAGAAPTVNDDSSAGYAIGSRWIDTTNDDVYQAVDVTVGAAVWRQLNGAAGSEYIHIIDQKAQNTDGGTFTSGADRTRDLNVLVSDTGGNASIDRLAFTSGSDEPNIGDTLSGQTSGATGDVLYINVTSGAWATNDAAGYFFLQNVTGTWQAETIDNDTQVQVDIATSSGAIANNQVCLVAGTYEIDASAPCRRVDEHVAWWYNVTDAGDEPGVYGTSEDSGNSDGTTNRSFVHGRFTIADTKVFELRHRCTTTVATTGFGRATNLRAEVYSQVILRKVS